MGGSPNELGWLANLHNSYAIHNVIAHRPELPVYVVRDEGEAGLHWMDLSDPRERLKPFHFEIFYGKESVRDDHYRLALDEARRTRRPVCRSLFGFWDLFCPLAPEEGSRTYLYVGQFYREQPDWETLCDQWRTLTGQTPTSANPDFVHFVRMALALPILEPELLAAYEEFLSQYAEFLTGRKQGVEIQQRIDQLNRETLSRLWPIETWVDSAIDPDKFALTPWRLDGKLTDWMKEGLGINRLPTTAMALMPLDSRSAPLDWVQTLVRNARIQRACIAFARELPETAATHLSDYGVSLITSTRAGKNVARARLELREHAQRFQAFVKEKFHVRSVVGIGTTLSPGAPLHASHREAVLALHMCAQLERDVLFFDEHGGRAEFRYAELQAAASALATAFDRENATEVKLASDRYVQLVLRYSGERIEVARSQFLATLFQLFGGVLRRSPMATEARDRFASDLTRKLEEAPSLYQVIEAFKEALGRLSFVASKAWHGSNVMRLEATLQYLRENFAEPLPLPLVARKAGFSVPTFSRVFKKATGTSFLTYVRAMRVEHAKSLITTTPMSIDQIAQACGFQSQHHLIRSFKKATNQTPGAYRKAHASDYDS
ncbi:MAG TPA: AraC family transcriptional regulator [Kofleriaceae bacterium]|nr:AraC family transcriptional regulator [Kofleriaceae bacterium]